MPPSTTPTRKQRAAKQAGDVGPRAGFPCRRLQAGHPQRRKRQHVAGRDNANRNQHRAGIGALRLLNFRGNGRSVVPSHVVPHADEQAAENVDGGSCWFRDSIHQRVHPKRRQNNDCSDWRRQRKKQPQRSERYNFHSCNVQQGARDHDEQRHPPSAIAFLKPGKHAGQVGHEQRGINRHVENGRHQREPGFLKSPEVAHGAAHPGVVAAFVGQRAGEFADHKSRRQAPEQRGEKKNQDGAPVAGAVQNVFGAIGSARHHEERGRDQWPKRQAGEFLGPIGYGGEGLRIFELLTRCASCCQFLCVPPQATHSHHRVSLESSSCRRLSARGSRLMRFPGHLGEVSSQL